MYIYLNVCKQMTAVKLLLLHSKTWNHLTAWKNRAQAHLKMLSTKYLQMNKQEMVLHNLQ